MVRSLFLLVCFALSLMVLADDGDNGQWVFPSSDDDVSNWYIGRTYNAKFTDVPWPLLRIMLFCVKQNGDVADHIALTERFKNNGTHEFRIPEFLDVGDGRRWYLSLWGDNEDGSNTPNSNLDSHLRFTLKSAKVTAGGGFTATRVVTSYIGSSATSTPTGADRAAAATGSADSASTGASASATSTSDASSASTKVGLGVGLGLGLPLIAIIGGLLLLLRKRSKLAAANKTISAPYAGPGQMNNQTFATAAGSMSQQTNSGSSSWYQTKELPAVPVPGNEKDSRPFFELSDSPRGLR